MPNEDAQSEPAAPSLGTAPVDLDYHCTIKCSSCGKKNYFTRRELEESHLRATDAAPSVAPEPPSAALIRSRDVTTWANAAVDGKDHFSEDSDDRHRAIPE